MRLFLAVRFPPDLAVRASAALPEMKILRRVAPEVMHITLAFVGRVPDTALAGTMAAAEDAARGVNVFRLELGALGQFPERGRPHVVWLGFREPAPLLDLAERTRRALTEHGVEFDPKPFRPHLTLARVREDADRVAERDLTIALRQVTPPAGSFVVDTISIIESVLSPKGPRYSDRAKQALEAGRTR